MLIPWSVPSTPLAAAVCLALLCHAPTRADASSDTPPQTGSVQHPHTPSTPASQPPLAGENGPADKPTAEQVAEAADYILGGLVQATQALVLTMGVSPWEFKQSPQTDPVPESVVPIIVQPPTPPIDVPPGGGVPQGGPTPSSNAPEPGTLAGGLIGAGACLYRYFRRRKQRTATPAPESQPVPV